MIALTIAFGVVAVLVFVLLVWHDLRIADLNMRTKNLGQHAGGFQTRLDDDEKWWDHIAKRVDDMDTRRFDKRMARKRRPKK